MGAPCQHCASPRSTEPSAGGAINAAPTRACSGSSSGAFSASLLLSERSLKPANKPARLFRFGVFARGGFNFLDQSAPDHYGIRKARYPGGLLRRRYSETNADGKSSCFAHSSDLSAQSF